MKKYNLFKVLAITIFITWLLTLFIPGSYVDYTGEVATTGITGVGIWGLLSNLSISISYFNAIAVFLIALACFYAVLNKVDVYNTLGISGKEVEKLLESINITLNKNTIPGEKLPPMEASGVRIGTPAMTTRGFKEEEFIKVVHYIDKAIKNRNNESLLNEIKEEVLILTSRFPLFKN